MGATPAAVVVAVSGVAAGVGDIAGVSVVGGAAPEFFCCSALAIKVLRLVYSGESDLIFARARAQSEMA